ncbi:MAG: retron St85 family effector protein [Acidithiobacillus ferriphilus]|uniref:retron St85 family effector protein n=1 Tax=Acidithiobacillus ferriphilus TaxID=1689834 RepID=UPI001C07DD99|nr:retron St85 family effector protein [Acidithiobacillus ferriphilus]
MSSEPLGHLLDQLAPGACRIINLPDRIWLFGGKGGFRSETTEPVACESLRESFWRQSLALPFSQSQGQTWSSNIDIPENHSGWWAFSGYDNLLTFERDACHLARAVILFPESPGSLAELGALAVDDSIVDRLLVVVQSQYLEPDRRESFLNLGPLKRAEARHNRCVISARTPKELPADDFETVIEFVNARLPRARNTEGLRAENPTHRLLLIADLVDLLLIVRPNELLAALHYFGVNISMPELERATKLLEFFDLVRIDHWGMEHFFVQRRYMSRAWVAYTSNAGRPTFDRSRFKVDRKASLITDRRQLAVLERTV